MTLEGNVAEPIGNTAIVLPALESAQGAAPITRRMRNRYSVL